MCEKLFALQAARIHALPLWKLVRRSARRKYISTERANEREEISGGA